MGQKLMREMGSRERSFKIWKRSRNNEGGGKNSGESSRSFIYYEFYPFVK